MEIIAKITKIIDINQQVNLKIKKSLKILILGKLR